jgi:TetR/AcrR family transcriptional regulator, cholesterol catabolism regulator
MGDAKQANKERLLDVAIDLFSSKGFAGTSIRDIAREMGMSISNIYHYFGNKNGLLLEVLKRASIDVVTSLRAVSEKDMEPFDRFKIILKTHVSLCAEHWKESKIFLLDEEHLTPEGVEINMRIQREVFDIYFNELNNLKKLGIVKSESLNIMAFNILGVINWQLRWYRPKGRLSISEVTDEVVSFILYGITGAADIGTLSGESK